MNYRGERISVYAAQSFDGTPASAGRVRIEKSSGSEVTDFDRQMALAAASSVWESGISYSGFPFYDQDWQAYRPACADAGWGNNLACGLAATDFDRSERAEIYRWLLLNSIGMGYAPHLRRTRVVEEQNGTRLMVLQPMLSHFATLAGLLRDLGVDGFFLKPRRMTTMFIVARDAGLVGQLKGNLFGVPDAVIDDIIDCLPERYFTDNEAIVAYENEIVLMLNKHYRLSMLEKAYQEYRARQNPLFDPAIQDGISLARSSILTTEREALTRLYTAFQTSLTTLADKTSYLLGVLDGPHQTAITTFLTQHGVKQNVAAADFSAAFSAISGALTTWRVYSDISDDYRWAFLLANLISFVDDARSVCPQCSSYNYSEGDAPLPADLVLADMPNVLKDLGGQYESQYYSTILGIVDSRWTSFVESFVLDCVSFAKAAQESKGASLKLYPLFFMGSASEFGAAAGTWLSQLGNTDEIEWAKGTYSDTLAAMRGSLEVRDEWAKKIWGDNACITPILSILLDSETPQDDTDAEKHPAPGYVYANEFTASPGTITYLNRSSGSSSFDALNGFLDVSIDLIRSYNSAHAAYTIPSIDYNSDFRVIMRWKLSGGTVDDNGVGMYLWSTADGAIIIRLGFKINSLSKSLGIEYLNYSPSNRETLYSNLIEGTWYKTEMSYTRSNRNVTFSLLDDNDSIIAQRTVNYSSIPANRLSIGKIEEVSPSSTSGQTKFTMDYVAIYR